MAKFDVVDLSNKKVSEIELSDDVFGAEAQRPPAVRGGEDAADQPPSGHGGGEEQLARLRRR